MDFKQLQYFLKVCDCQSFTGAANALYISQQGLSNAMARLEKELGVPLFERLPKGVALTGEGRFFAEKAREMARSYEEVLMHFTELEREQSIRLTVCASFGVMMRLSDWVPMKFREYAPSITLEITECPDLKCEELVQNGLCDVGFTSGQIDRRRFSYEPMFSAAICAIVNVAHPLARCDRLTYAQMKDTPIYMMNRLFHTNMKFHQRCREAGFVPQIAYETMDMGVVFNAARNNFGIGIVNAHTASCLKTPEIKVLPIDDPSFTWDVNMIWRRGGELKSAGKVFLRFCKNALAAEKR